MHLEKRAQYAIAPSSEGGCTSSRIATKGQSAIEGAQTAWPPGPPTAFQHSILKHIGQDGSNIPFPIQNKGQGVGEQ
jgi:hypothetical protein